MTERGAEQEAWEMIAKQHVAMLTTEEGGDIVTRPMGSLARPEDGKIYFVSHKGAGVLGEIGASARVNLAYCDPSKNEYVSVSGTASASQDREKLRELWSMWTEAWLPEGPDGEDVVLITVTPGETKLWNATSSSAVYVAKVLAAVARQSPPDGGTVKQVHL